MSLAITAWHAALLFRTLLAPWQQGLIGVLDCEFRAVRFVWLGDGGELVLQPFLAPAETIAPTMDRLVPLPAMRLFIQLDSRQSVCNCIRGSMHETALLAYIHILGVFYADLVFAQVLFKSDRCLHRVMPTSAERFCCTVRHPPASVSV